MKRLLTIAIITLAIGAHYLYGYFACGGTGTVNWTLIGNTGMGGVVGYTIDGNDRIYAASNSGGGFARSTDHGVTWAAFNTGASSPCHWGIGLNDIGEVVSGSLHNGTVTACGTNDPHNALRLVGNALPWVPASLPNCGFGVPYFPVIVRHVGGVTLIAGSSWPPYRSLDHGATWVCPTTPMPKGCGERIGLEVANDGKTLALGTGIACTFQYYSTDSGDTWTTFPQQDPWLAGGHCTSTADNHWNILPNGNLLFSGGTSCNFSTWCYGPQPPPHGTYSICYNGLQAPFGITNIVTNNAKTLVVGVLGGNGSTSSFGCGLYQSTDNGVHWTQANGTAPNNLPFTSGNTNNCGYPKIADIIRDSSGFFYVIANNGDVYKTTSVP